MASCLCWRCRPLQGPCVRARQQEIAVAVANYMVLQEE